MHANWNVEPHWRQYVCHTMGDFFVNQPFFLFGRKWNNNKLFCHGLHSLILFGQKWPYAKFIFKFIWLTTTKSPLFFAPYTRPFFLEAVWVNQIPSYSRTFAFELEKKNNITIYVIKLFRKKNGFLWNNIEMIEKVVYMNSVHIVIKQWMKKKLSNQIEHSLLTAQTNQSKLIVPMCTQINIL